MVHFKAHTGVLLQQNARFESVNAVGGRDKLRGMELVFPGAFRGSVRGDT